ncbi:hypothetical protein [Actinoallomurus purpureus]|nr:hypothetical protein [Actinoallomurus purpureus]
MLVGEVVIVLPVTEHLRIDLDRQATSLTTVDDPAAPARDEE